MKSELRDGARFGERVTLLSPAAVLLLATLLPVSFSTPVPLCAVRALTGAECAGCGMTRAFLLIGHGRLAEAAAAHPLAAPAFLVVAGMAVAGAVRALGGRADQSRRATCRRSRTESGPGERPSGS